MSAYLTKTQNIFEDGWKVKVVVLVPTRQCTKDRVAKLEVKLEARMVDLQGFDGFAEENAKLQQNYKRLVQGCRELEG